MKRVLLYISALLFVASCTESEYDGTRKPSLNRRYLNVPEASLTFDAKPSSRKLLIESDQTDWHISIPADWVTANHTSGNTSMSVDFSAQLNNSADVSRVCIATIASNVSDWSRSFPVTITQEKNAPYIIVSGKDIVCNALKQQKSISVNANTEYVIDNTASSWLHVEAAEGNEIRINIDENNSGEERNAVLTFKAKAYSGVSTMVSVRQKIANITSTKETLTFGHASSSQTIQIESEASWSASSTSWLYVSPSSGSAGKTEVTVSVPRNASVNSRSGSVYFNIAGNNNIEVPVMQEGVSLGVSPTDIAFTSFGGSQSLAVESNEKWTITEKSDWISVDKVSGDGNATIEISVAENNTTSEKSGIITIVTDDGVTSKTIHVKQGAKTVEYGDATLEYGYAAGTQYISFTTDGNWSLTKDADWISVDRTSGSGSATLGITVEENNTMATRSGIVSLSIADKSFTISINQNCKYVTLSSSAFTFTADEGTTKVSIGSNTHWNAKVCEGSEWLSVTPSVGSENAEVTISVSENKTIDKRTGKIEIEIPNVHTYVIDITQNRRYIKTDMSSVDFTQAGGQISFNVITDGTYEVSRIGDWFGYVENGDVITVIASQNDTGTTRSGAMKLTLTNVEGNVSLLVPVIQLVR